MSMSSDIVPNEVPPMSEAQRRAQARKQKILAKGNERILAAKGEAPLSQATAKSRPLATRKAKEMGYSECPQTPDAADTLAAVAPRTSNIDCQEVKGISADTAAPTPSVTPAVTASLAASLEGRKKLESEIIRHTEEFDRQQLEGKTDTSSRGDARGAHGPSSTSNSSPPLDGEKTITSERKMKPTNEKPSAAPADMSPPAISDPRLRKGHVIAAVRLTLVIVLAVVSGYFHAVDTSLYQSTYPEEYDRIFTATDGTSMFAPFFRMFETSADNSRSALLSYTQSRYATESAVDSVDQSSDVQSVYMDAPSAARAGGTICSVLGLVRNPVTAVALAWALGSCISSLPVIDVLLRRFVVMGADSGATTKTSLVGTMFQLLVGDYSYIVDCLLDICGQISLHVVLSFGICTLFLNILSRVATVPHSVNNSLDEL